MTSWPWTCAAVIAAALGAPALAQPAGAAAPSFDCAKAGSAAEKLVCSDPRLAAMDRETARLYRLASTDPKLPAGQLAQLKGAQRGWIKGRDDCWKDDDQRGCIVSSYAQRVHELRQASKAARAVVPAAGSTGPLPYHCDGLDGLIGVTFLNVGGGAAYLQWKDRGIGMTQASGAPGAHYAGKSFDGAWGFSPKGKTAQLIRPAGPVLACTEEPMG